MGSQIPGQTNVDDTLSFSAPRHPRTHLNTLVSALDTTLSIPTIIWTMAAIGVVPTILWTLWVVRSRQPSA